MEIPDQVRDDLCEERDDLCEGPNDPMEIRAATVIPRVNFDNTRVLSTFIRIHRVNLYGDEKKTDINDRQIGFGEGETSR